MNNHVVNNDRTFPVIKTTVSKHRWKRSKTPVSTGKLQLFVNWWRFCTLHNVLRCHQRTTKPRPQVTCTENFEICEQTDAEIAILSTAMWPKIDYLQTKLRNYK